jgi:hypothetical protein
MCTANNRVGQVGLAQTYYRLFKQLSKMMVP